MQEVDEGDPLCWRLTVEQQSQGIMAYVGAYRAIVQLNKPQGKISGRAAWIMWRGAYLTRAISWRNRVLIPMFWLLNWYARPRCSEYLEEVQLTASCRAFGRDISRF